jgi:hypothetical protein
MSAKARVAELSTAERDDGDEHGVQGYVGGFAVGGLDFGWRYDGWRGVGVGED